MHLTLSLLNCTATSYPFKLPRRKFRICKDSFDSWGICSNIKCKKEKYMFASPSILKGLLVTSVSFHNCYKKSKHQRIPEGSLKTGIWRISLYFKTSFLTANGWGHTTSSHQERAINSWELRHGRHSHHQDSGWLHSWRGINVLKEKSRVLTLRKGKWKEEKRPKFNYLKSDRKGKSS